MAYQMVQRPRRLRQNPWMRELVAENRLHASDFIWPLFIAAGDVAEAVPSLPGVMRLPIAEIVTAAQRAESLGIAAIALFPATPADKKSDDAAEALNPDNLVCRTVRAIKQAGVQVGIVCDVALDPYTSHGHDGLLVNGEVDNDSTVTMLCRQALVLAEAGADVVAPSDMMDGRVAAIRTTLDSAGFERVAILSYAVKYASAFYGPFRDAVGSKSALGKADKRTYQMDARNAQEAIREASLDVGEGADMLMVKPGMPYLDVLHGVAQRSLLPVLAYQVSGEYAMIKAAAAQGWLDERAVVLESLMAFKRAGARAVFTYFAPQAAEWLAEMPAEANR